MVTQFPLLQAEMLGEAETPAPSLESLLGDGTDTPSTENPDE